MLQGRKVKGAQTRALPVLPSVEGFGGADRDRTDDLVIANDALSQLSYDPTFDGGCFAQSCILVKHVHPWQTPF